MPRHRISSTYLAAGLALALLATACTEKSTSSAQEQRDAAIQAAGARPADRYEATITRTTGGVPHIKAATMNDALFGEGWASFEDHSCDLADQLVKLAGRRAEFFGPGEGDANVQSDFAWRTIGIDGLARADYASAGSEVTAAFEAFATGWSSALAKTGRDRINGWCASAPWVRPVTGEDVYAYGRSIALAASSTQLTGYIGTAQPPTETGRTAAEPAATSTATSTATPHATFATQLSATSNEVPTAMSPPAVPLASNGWAIGKQRSADGGGMLLANPHFPWDGALRFWEVHLEVPGVADIYGAHLTGLPGVGIGFTRHVAWTHTVSAGHRFTAYRLTLDPADPTHYIYDGASRAMTSRRETIQVRGDDGTLTPLSRTVWFSHYGPILDFPGVGWSTTTTLTYRDANIDDTTLVAQYLAMDRAESLDALIAAHRRYQGVPLFNTIASDDRGNAWYADTSATPNLSDAALAAYEKAKVDDPFTRTAADSAVVLLDGSTSRDEWVDVPGARSPGLVPFSRMPQVTRTDYLFNANDSFWLPNADHPLTGDYSPMHGDQKSILSLRTRENAFVLRDTSADGASGDDGRFTLAELRSAALKNEASSAVLYRDEVVRRCEAAAPTMRSTVGAACPILAAWDGRFDVDSVGAVLWREIFVSAESWPALTPFEPTKPVDTPAGIAPADSAATDPVLAGISAAVQRLRAANIALDAPLGAIQRDGRFAAGAGSTGLGGGFGSEGVTNVVAWSGQSTTLEPRAVPPGTVTSNDGLATDWYPINYGTSFLMAVSLTPSGPRASSILTYGETQDRTSPLFTSQTKRFAAKDFKPVLLTAKAIAAGAISPPMRVTAER